MKKILIFFLLIILIVSTTGCVVSTITGIIQIINTSAQPMVNLKVGSTLIVFYLAPGAKYDYWIYGPLSGVITAEDFQSSIVVVNFDVGKWGRIYAQESLGDWILFGEIINHPYE